MKDFLKRIAQPKAAITFILIGALSITFLSFNDKDFKIVKNLDIFVDLFQQVTLYYVDETDPEELINASIKGMLESLDPYTSYIPESEMDEFRFMTTGEYGGIGALIRKAGDFTIISEPYEGFPAQQVGLRAGDTLVRIDGVTTQGKNVSDVSELLKGTPNTELSIQVRRNLTDTLQFSFERKKITIPNVPYFGMLDNKIGYIRLSNFTRDAGKEVRNAFNNLKAGGAQSVILDLRSNPGGLLDESVDVTNTWIGKGKKVVYTHGKTKQWDKEYYTTKPAADTSMPLAVLVDRGSASASEIVAGSLQDFDRAVIVGERTFGKGLVQTTRPLSYKTQLKITTAKYYIPSGRCIQALDYTHRNEDGSVGHIPDSLISEFKTKNGRTVLDGGGIRPDINIETLRPANISILLYTSNLIFDFATYYTSRHDTIISPEEFVVDEALYNTFLSWLNDKELDYNTSSTDQLDELIKTVKREGYYKIAQQEIDQLREKLVANKNKDLQTFSNEISGLLKEEIVSRYYYQKGRILTSLKNDPQLNKAIEILSEKEAVDSILLGVYKNGDIKLALDN